MAQEQWTAVDRYITDLLVPADAALDAALRESTAAGLPAINVSPNQGKMLMMLARMVNARNVLEIGTLGGYSTLWLARGVTAGGRVVTLEAEPRHADVARRNIARAGMDKIIEICVGKALELLPSVQGTFDLVFVDADKQSCAEYFDWGVRLSRPGGVIIVDNVIRDGAVADATTSDERVRGVRRFMAALSADRRVTATAIQTVGAKGYDGFAVAVVN